MIAGRRHLTVECEIKAQGLSRGAGPSVRPQSVRRRFFLALAAISLIGCRNWAEKKPAVVDNSAENARLKERLANVDAILEKQREEQHIPGLSLVIVRDDEVVYLKAFGLRDLDNELPATPDTVFPIGSCTKAFTSMAVAISQDEGKLSLDDSPKKFLPYFKLADPNADARVTLRDMLSHRTGLKAYADLAAEPAILTREEYIRAATSAKPATKFRTGFQYSNAMFAAVGEIVGKANHSTWERVIQTKIFAPLGMTSSITAARDVVQAADHAKGYLYEGKTWRQIPPPASLEAMAPAGNIASTARDMGQWVRLLTGNGSIGGKRIVSEELFRALTTPIAWINPSTSYALGWATLEWNGHRVVEHNGGSSGISALVSFMPDRHVGFAFLANTSPNYMTKIGNAGKLLWPIILGEKGPPSEGEAPREAAWRSGNGAAPPADLPSTDALVARMVAAVGGEENLRRHTSLEIHAQKSYDNQGVMADLVVWAKAPSMHTEEEVWSAAGKPIGRLRIYFDGARGGQETTFGQSAVNDDKANERARRNGALHPLLELNQLYKSVRVVNRVNLGAEEAYVLELTAKKEKPVLFYVSTRSALVVQRQSNGESASFDDYRMVDGELIPFHTTIQDALGETTVQIQDVRFNTVIADAVFEAGGASRG